jgi:radical SAM-linked protein
VGVDPGAYLRPRDLSEALPWDHIRTPVVKKFLLAEREKAYAAALTPDCRDHACYRCGAPCFTPKAREGRRVSLQIAPGQGTVPATLDFHVPDDVTQADIAARVRQLSEAPIEKLKTVPAPAPAERPHPVAPGGPYGSHAAEGGGASPGTGRSSASAPATNGRGGRAAARNGQKPPAASANGAGNAAVEESRQYGRRRRVWPVASRGPQSSRFRVRYEKTGTARFTSHLDLVRIFDRALRAARVPMAYSQGYNRHAKIAYGPPLSLGASSASEYFDLELCQPCGWDGILKMNEVLPDGIRIADGRPFQRSVDSLMAVIARADYRVRFTDYLLDRLTRGEDLHRVREELERNVSALLAAAEWLVTKPGHGAAAKTVNVRGALAGIDFEGSEPNPAVFIRSRLHAPGYLRPDLLVRSLLPSFEFDPRLLRVRREALWVERGATLITPLDALEESSFWRARPVDGAPAEGADPALEVDAPGNRH